MPRRYLGLGLSRPFKIPSVRRLGQLMSLCRFYVLVYDIIFFQSRCISFLLATFTHVYLFPLPRGHTPLSTVRSRLNPHLCLQRLHFPLSRHVQRPVLSLLTQFVHSFFFPLRPLRTVPSMFPNTNRFGNRPPLIWMSAPVHKRLLLLNVASMLFQYVFRRHGRTRLSDGLVSCAAPR